MNADAKDAIRRSIEHFSLPPYNEIPNVGLYLEQTSQYISEYLQPLGSYTLTGSMISNYVKQGLIDNPVKKRYYREQICYLIFITLVKSVIRMEDLGLFIGLQKRTYDTRVAYEYFREELQNVLMHIFGLKDTLDTVGVDSTDEKIMLRNTIITLAHKVYLDKFFACLHETEQ